MPELDVLLLTRFPNLHSDFSHVWDRGIGPVAVSPDEREESLHVAQVGLRTVFGEEGVDFVASLPVGHVGAKHAAIVARLIDENLGVELFKSGLKNVAKRGEEALDSERGRLMRRRDQLRQEIQTYENNLGFLNASSKKGNSLIDEMNRKVQKLRDDLELVCQKIKAVNSEKK